LALLFPAVSAAEIGGIVVVVIFEFVGELAH